MKTHAWGTQPEMFGPRHEHRLGMFTRETAKLARGSRILDAAVGLGQLASKVLAQGHRVFGVDASFEAARHSRTLGIHALVGDLTKLPFKTAMFDAVTSGETLEHLDGDRPAAEEIARVTKPGGRCIVTVPALRSLWSRSDDYYEHRRRYSREELTALFDSNFEIERASFWGFPVVLVYDTLFLLPMNLRRSQRDPSRDGALKAVSAAGRSRILVSAVRAMFSIDRLFSFLPFGPGLFFVGRRK